jgi:RNA polymerase-binding transcription factor DksA
MRSFLFEPIIMKTNANNKNGTRNDVVPPATSEQILGRPVDAADRDPVAVAAANPVHPKWKPYYQRLIEIRDGVIDQETRLDRQSRENQPEFIKDTAAEAASSSFTRDMALGRVSGYQDMLNEINQALARIEDGTYGICEVTGKEIPAQRLKAIPWTRFSREAEEDLERKGNAPVRFELSPQFTTGDAFAGYTEVESTRHREDHTGRT